MKSHELKILIGSARSELKSAYNDAYPQITFDVMVQADLHCRDISGVETRFHKSVETLEALETQLEDEEEKVFLPRWRARRMVMEGLLESGAIKGKNNVLQAANFLVLIDKNLASDNQITSSAGMSDSPHLRELMHPKIVESSWAQFEAGYLRDAVLNSLIAVGDLIRLRTGLALDGKALVEQALSIQNPHLILSDLTTESGRNDQLGFMQILSGSFVGIRNPKAHSLLHDLDRLKAAQYLGHASLLASRVADAKLPPTSSA